MRTATVVRADERNVGVHRRVHAAPVYLEREYRRPLKGWRKDAMALAEIAHNDPKYKSK